jgi:hypothetical protein
MVVSPAPLSSAIQSVARRPLRPSTVISTVRSAPFNGSRSGNTTWGRGSGNLVTGQAAG